MLIKLFSFSKSELNKPFLYVIKFLISLSSFVSLIITSKNSLISSFEDLISLSIIKYNASGE